MAATPVSVTDLTAAEPRICSRSSSMSADSLASPALARSRSAAGTSPVRSTAFSTSDRTSANRFARLVVAAARSSSASAVTWDTIGADVTAAGSISTAWAASVALALESSVSPEASWM